VKTESRILKGRRDRGTFVLRPQGSDDDLAPGSAQ
jgi:hypothetical protein